MAEETIQFRVDLHSTRPAQPNTGSLCRCASSPAAIRLPTMIRPQNREGDNHGITWHGTEEDCRFQFYPSNSAEICVRGHLCLQFAMDCSIWNLNLCGIFKLQLDTKFSVKRSNCKMVFSQVRRSALLGRLCRLCMCDMTLGTT
jgi:hypothetical protein